MTRRPPQLPFHILAQIRIHLFQRPEKARKSLLQVRWPPPRLPEVPMPELIAPGHDSRAHRPVFMCSLRPNQIAGLINPDCKPHLPK